MKNNIYLLERCTLHYSVGSYPILQITSSSRFSKKLEIKEPLVPAFFKSLQELAVL
jgi:hypothetical protein